jgi:hypothetical protein
MNTESCKIATTDLFSRKFAILTRITFGLAVLNLAGAFSLRKFAINLEPAR